MWSYLETNSCVCQALTSTNHPTTYQFRNSAHLGRRDRHINKNKFMLSDVFCLFLRSTIVRRFCVFFRSTMSAKVHDEHIYVFLFLSNFSRRQECFFFLRPNFSSPKHCKPNMRRHALRSLIVVNKSSYIHQGSLETHSRSLTHTSPCSFISQMATRLQFIRSSWFSRHLCRSSSQSVLLSQCFNSVNYSVSSRNMSACKGASAKCLQMDNINPCIKTMEYAVR